jgi:hypothetical protein
MSREKEKKNLTPGQGDLGPILGAWAYDEENAVRRIVAEDGRELLQVRLPLGVEQYELSGRPDGARPKNHESWFHYFRKKARAEAESFSLTDEDVETLYEEGLLYYYRYLRFFQIKEYRLCVRDTRRNLKLLDFISRFATGEQAENLTQYHPYILRMNVMARALLKVQDDGDVRGALRILDSGRRAVRDLPEVEGSQVFAFERVRSLKSLDDLYAQLEQHLPVPRVVTLERQMERAVQKEDYERAAVLRDEIRRLRTDGE